MPLRRDVRERPQVVHRRVRGRFGLVVGLHGYGGDEHQLETLVPLDLPITTAVPRAPFPVEPGYGWWLPEQRSKILELAPAGRVDAAVEHLATIIGREQQLGGFTPATTHLLGYSQGAVLALTLAARRPGLIAGVITGAGALLPEEAVRSHDVRLRMLIMNGSLDPVVTDDSHATSVEAFRRAGHDVDERIDGVPHVIDAAQARAASNVLAEWLGCPRN